MHRPNLLRALKLPEESSLEFTKLDLQVWGRDLVFNVRATPPQAESIIFKLSFYDCRETRWQIYTHFDAQEAFPATELVGFSMGRNQHRSPARILSEHFALIVVYGALYLETENEKQSLEAQG